MNKGLLTLNIVLLIAVAWLFYRQIDTKKTKQPTVVNSFAKEPDTDVNPFRIAYFEIDSVSEHFAMVKDVRAELDRKQDSINAEMDKLDRAYHDKYDNYQKKASTMSKTESEAAANDLMKTQDDIKNQKKDLTQKYNDLVARRMTEVKSKIEEFLKEFNKDKKFSYIISYEPGFLYYKDTAYNITAEVIKGLNSMYKSKKN